ncbi:carbonic anhydrase [Rugamonas aquatica]|uniref:Carbonic anhydrase n=1 Tax=Rugamonas aquatica TaxID=2743357 RepID=A0A6A7N6J8_9BURK|nr:carbonic anhydrase [Rugamonas aquatica]MQA40755.1 carbonic anhydrase [Rugamonas aquatica]
MSNEHHNDNATGGGDLCSLLRGVEEFTRDIFPNNRDLFKSLAQGQAPHTLFITCADSRVVPEMITQTQPGELFVCRNIGNIVPSYGQMLGGVSAVIEYAVAMLSVRQIVICGHSDCGAMKGLMTNTTNAQDMPAVTAWLRNAEAARSVILTRKLDGAATATALVQENIRLQLMHLRTHPAVAARLAEGRLNVQGWVYDIEHGTVTVYDDASGSFQSISAAQARGLPPETR